MSDATSDRREWLQTAAALALSGSAMAAAPVPQPGPAMTAQAPARRTPGKAGDFDFLTGTWAIRNQRKLPNGDWDRFDGEARCFGILGGVVSVEELRIPARSFSGMGLRVLDAKQQLWHDVWVNAAFGVLSAPGIPGSFENGAGLFESADDDDGKPITVRGVWDLITPRSCRWQQGVSRDGGKTWDVGWSMDWTRQA